MQPRVGERWKFCKSKFPKEEIIYFCQVLMVYIVVITNIVNLCISDTNTCLWSSLVSGSVGYLYFRDHRSARKKKMTSFHTILPSNRSMNTYPDNTLNHYVTALSNRIKLDGDWKVALSEILFQRTWYNMQEDECNAGQRDRYVSSRRLLFRWIPIGWSMQQNDQT